MNIVFHSKDKFCEVGTDPNGACLLLLAPGGTAALCRLNLGCRVGLVLGLVLSLLSGTGSGSLDLALLFEGDSRFFVVLLVLQVLLLLPLLSF